MRPSIKFFSANKYLLKECVSKSGWSLTPDWKEVAQWAQGWEEGRWKFAHFLWLRPKMALPHDGRNEGARKLGSWEACWWGGASSLGQESNYWRSRKLHFGNVYVAHIFYNYFLCALFQSSAWYAALGFFWGGLFLMPACLSCSKEKLAKWLNWNVNKRTESSNDNIAFWSETHLGMMLAASATVLGLGFLIRKMGIRIVPTAEGCWEAGMRSCLWSATHGQTGYTAVKGMGQCSTHEWGARRGQRGAESESPNRQGNSGALRIWGTWDSPSTM